MKKETFNINDYKLHIIKDDKFRSITTHIHFRREIKKENITIDSLLFKVLLHSNRDYPTRIGFERKIEELYGINIYSNSIREGNNIYTLIGANILDDKYTEEGNFYKSLDFLKSIIFSPNVCEGKFDEKAYSYAKNKIVNNIKKIDEKIKLRANYDLLDLIDKDAVFSIRMLGYLKDLKDITRESLYKYYIDFFNNTIIDIYIMGNVNEKEIIKYFENNFIFNNNKIKINDYSYKFKIKKVNKVIKEEKSNQAVLKVAYSIDNASIYENHIVSSLYNVILSGMPSSKFFQNIREKYSLCYYIRLDIMNTDSLAIITSEIEKKSFNKMLKLIDKEMKDMNDGIFSDEDLENAKKFIVFILKDYEEYYGDYIYYDYFLSLTSNYSIDEVIEKIQKVTKEEVVEFSKKLHKNKIYLLGGDS